jgi:hypothetical protein
MHCRALVTRGKHVVERVSEKVIPSRLNFETHLSSIVPTCKGGVGLEILKHRNSHFEAFTESPIILKALIRTFRFFVRPDLV